MTIPYLSERELFPKSYKKIEERRKERRREYMQKYYPEKESVQKALFMELVYKNKDNGVIEKIRACIDQARKMFLLSNKNTREVFD